MTEWIAIGISGIALSVSGVTAWLVFFRRGELNMTQPTVVYFGPDGGSGVNKKGHSKVFLRTLLFSTSQKGQMLESMHISLQRGETKQNFSIWVYGEDKLVRGSGLFVGPGGVSHNHHFLLPEDGSDFKFLAGKYRVTVFSKRVSDSKPRKLSNVELIVTESQAKEMENENIGIYFDWGPDQQEYHGHVDDRKRVQLPPRLDS